MGCVHPRNVCMQRRGKGQASIESRISQSGWEGAVWEVAENSGKLRTRSPRKAWPVRF